VALRDFFDYWPELLYNNLYITGESYGGIYAPFLAL
jgi:carboxypeptidase C (cathepsin A)